MTFDVVVTAPGLAPEAAAVLEAAGCRRHAMPPYPSAEAVAALVGTVQADAIIARQGPITSAVITASPRLRIVARHGVGVDEVDLEAARAHGVMVTRAPGSNTAAVAEATLAFILGLAKGLGPNAALVAAGGWRGADVRGRDVAGMRLGLVGYGDIGRAVARLAGAFGMVVAGYDPQAASWDGAARVATLAELLASSDVLSVHCPLLPSTRGLIDAAALAALPAGAFVVNTARGGIVDEAALLGALESGRLAGAALDVFEAEPPTTDHPLRAHPRVLVTPHIAGVTAGSLRAMGVMAAECVAAALTGGVVAAERIVVG